MEFTYTLTFLITFVASALSGMAGGGVSFITTPFWLIVGMTPAQGGATGAFMATGMSLSSVAVFRKSDHITKDKRLLAALSVVTLCASIIGSLVVPKIDIGIFKTILAIITIISIPLLFVKPAPDRAKKNQNIGLLIAMLLMGVGSIIISGAFSILFTLTLISYYGMSVIQTTAIKRILFFIQSVVLLVGFALQGFLIWQFAVAGFLGGVAGAYLGTKFAVKKGDVFAKYALAAMALVGALALLL